MLKKRRIAAASVLAVANKNGNKPQPLQLLNCASPRSALFEIGSYDQRCIGKRIDDFITLHCMTDVKSGRRIIGGYKDEPPIH